MASAMHGNNGVYMVPALTGLGAPHRSPNARGVSMVTRDTGLPNCPRGAGVRQPIKHVDLFTAIARTVSVSVVRVDGGMTPMTG